MNAMTTQSATARKGRWALLSGALIAAAGILVGGLMYLLNTGELGQRLTPGQAVTVTLASPSAEKMVWARQSDQGYPQLRCPIRPVDSTMAGTSEVNMLDNVIELTVDGERWRGLLVVSGDSAGRYEVTCSAGGTNSTPVLSIGDPPPFYGPRDGLLYNAAALGLAGLGVIIGFVVVGFAAWRWRSSGPRR